MKLFIAEKPDLAKSIGAGIEGSYESFDGYFKKGENLITWAFGHLLELYMPEDYDEKYQKWDLDDLPLKISNFKYKPKDSSKKQLKIICDLINSKNITSIVNCGDADEEGQILIDEILEYAKNTKPVERLLLHDLTPKGVKDELKKMKSNDDFKNLSECGFARSIADWIVGINLTRAYTSKVQSSGYNGVLSVGRVQTPILSLIVARDNEHENHKSTFYFTLTGKFKTSNENANLNAVLKTDEKILNENETIEIQKFCENKMGIIKIKNENKKENPPLPYNLLNLQAEASKKFGYKPDKTLEITQNLREKYKCITYNRSDCEYLPKNMFESSADVLKVIRKNISNEFENLIDNADTKIKSEAFNDKFITAHFAIIPTQAEVDFNSMSKDEQNIYKLISLRYIAQFYEPMEYLQTNIEILINDKEFIASKRKIIKNGFYKVLKNDKGDETDENEVSNDFDISTLKDGACVCENITISKKQTKPKPYYTMASLLKDLTSISKYVKDEKIKALLKEKDREKKGENGGIGTPATRSEHIKKLFEREYITENKKSIISTKKGRDLISLAPQILTSPDMTALWFELQKDIQSGSLSRDDFLKEVNKEVDEQISQIKNNALLNQNFSGLDKTYPCKCGKGYLQKRHSQKTGKDFWGCSDWKNGCKEIYPDKNGKPDLNANKSDYICPQCKKGYLIKHPSQKNKKKFWWGCSDWKNGCKYTCFDDNGKPKGY